MSSTSTFAPFGLRSLALSPEESRSSFISGAERRNSFFVDNGLPVGSRFLLPWSSVTEDERIILGGWGLQPAGKLLAEAIAVVERGEMSPQGWERDLPRRMSEERWPFVSFEIAERGPKTYGIAYRRHDGSCGWYIGNSGPYAMRSLEAELWPEVEPILIKLNVRDDLRKTLKDDPIWGGDLRLLYHFSKMMRSMRMDLDHYRISDGWEIIGAFELYRSPIITEGFGPRKVDVFSELLLILAENNFGHSLGAVSGSINFRNLERQLLKVAGIPRPKLAIYHDGDGEQLMNRPPLECMQRKHRRWSEEITEEDRVSCDSFGGSSSFEQEQANLCYYRSSASSYRFMCSAS